LEPETSNLARKLNTRGTDEKTAKLGQRVGKGPLDLILAAVKRAAPQWYNYHLHHTMQDTMTSW